MNIRYNDIRDLLATKKLPGLSGRGVSNDEVNLAEQELNVRFPTSFRCFLNEHGWGYFGSLELIIGLGSDIPREWEAGCNIVRVVTDERNGPSRFPQKLIPICQNGAGDWYALDCSHRNEDESPVVFVSHEKTASEGFNLDVCAQSFAEWVYLKLS